MPGQASAFRRALDDQAANEGPLDLTVPLDIAEVRAALANSGPLPAVPADAAAPTSAAGPGSTPPRDHDGRHSRRHPGSKRLGRIAVFVVLAATASFGTAYALVVSSGSQGSSVSLPATDGNIPVAPSQQPSGRGQAPVSGASGSASASAAASLSHSPASTAQPTGTASAGASGAASSAAADPSASPSRSSRPSAPADPTTAPPSSAPASNWVTLYSGIQGQSQEVSQVQSMLEDLRYLENWHRHEYLNPQNFTADSNGTYGSATSNAVAAFQQQHGLAASGECDAGTFQALSSLAG